MKLITNFQQRKTSVLSKIDKSSKGDWDKKIISLCNKINSLEYYYTTSSCSGRIVLMIEQEKKARGLFLIMSHNLISFDWLKKSLNMLISFPSIHTLNKTFVCASHSKLIEDVNPKYFQDNKNFINNKISKDSIKSIKNKTIKFKLEQLILHVACKNLKSAKILLENAKKSGLKHSGIISSGKNIVVEICTTEKLEFPIINKNKILVDDGFLKLIVKQANEKLKRGWRKIKELEKSIY